MARFITTIELFNADQKDYETLQSELKKQSFTRRALQQSDSLPVKEEYNREGNITLQDVTHAVLQAAAKTGKKYSFTIIRNKPVYN
jgi:translation initiation factor 1 (eIF-1/SUI1)